MKALILKDCYVLWKQMRIFILLIVLMTVIDNPFYCIFPVVWASMLPYTAMAYDERSHWDQLAAMMPYSLRDLVLSKYVLGWLCMAAAMLLCLATQIVRGMISHTSPDYPVILMSFFFGIISLDITLPQVLRFGVERGRMGFMLVIFGVAILGGFMLDADVIGDNLFSLPVRLVVLLPVIAAAATVFSLSLSMRLYQRRN